MTPTQLPGGSVNWTDSTGNVYNYYTTTDLARYFGIHRRNMRTWLERHGWELEAIKLDIGKHAFIMYSEQVVREIRNARIYQRKRIDETGRNNVIKGVVKVKYTRTEAQKEKRRQRERERYALKQQDTTQQSEKKTGT